MKQFIYYTIWDPEAEAYFVNSSYGGRYSLKPKLWARRQDAESSLAHAQKRWHKPLPKSAKIVNVIVEVKL